MFKTPKELKTFILWAKAEKVSRLKVGDIEVEFSPYAQIEAVSGSIDAGDVRTPEQRKMDEERDYNDLLFHSSR